SLRYRRDQVKDPFGNRDPYRVTTGFDKVWRKWSGNAFLSYFKPAHDEDGVGLAEVALAFRPRDRVRLEAGYSQDVVLSRIALAQSIRVQTISAGIGWQPSERLELHAGQDLKDYNDGNQATLRSASVSGRIWSSTHTNADLGFRASRLETDQDLDNGYY